MPACNTLLCLPSSSLEDDVVCCVVLPRFPDALQRYDFSVDDEYESQQQDCIRSELLAQMAMKAM
jgi:hypothetical protein